MIQSCALPKHVQLGEMLIREIAAGRLADGARLPPERQMAADLGVAVGTLRRALADLAAKGLLERIQGSGNYVRARPVVDSIYAFFRLELAGGGGLPTAKVIDVSTLRKPEGVPAIGPGPIAHRIRRLRLLDAVAVAAEEIWLDGRFATRLRAQDLSDSLYFHYKRALGLVITRIEDRVSASVMPDWAPADLVDSSGEPCGYIERTGWAQDGAPAEFSRTWFHAGRARYTNRLQ